MVLRISFTLNMGATITTFCNAAKVFIYTELSVAAPYYWYDLAPNQCTDFTVGRVWFTATAKLSDKAGDLYFPVSENRAAGLLSHNGARELDFVDLSTSEANQIIVSPSEIINDDFQSVSNAYYKAKEKLSIETKGYYANSDKRITITGGPRAAIHKEHPRYPGKFITIVPATFGSLEMSIS